MSLQQEIEQKVKTAFAPEHLEVINESGMHSVPAGSETHFKLVIVTQKFEGKKLVERHRLVNQALVLELREKIHALSLQTLTPEEWEKKKGQIATSPPCLGGSK